MKIAHSFYRLNSAKNRLIKPPTYFNLAFFATIFLLFSLFKISLTYANTQKSIATQAQTNTLRIFDTPECKAATEALSQGEYEAAYRIFLNHNNIAAAYRIANAAVNAQPNSKVWKERQSAGAQHFEEESKIADYASNNQPNPCARLIDYPYGNVVTMLGYSTSVGAFVSAEFNDFNFLKKGWQLNTQGRLAQREQDISVRLAMPPNENGWANAFMMRYLQSTYVSTRLNSGYIGMERARAIGNTNTAFTLGFYRDRLKYEGGGEPWVSHALVPGIDWAYQTVDDAIYPRRGSTVNLTGQFAIKNVVAKQSFARLYGTARHYFPLAKNTTFFIRGEAGAVLTNGETQNVPASLLFRAGGADSIRGYRYQYIGESRAGSVLPVKYVMTASAEIQQWINRKVALAAFYDLGAATSNFDKKPIYQGVGVGLRWRSPIGPVNFDLAYGIRERGFRPYISIGTIF